MGAQSAVTTSTSLRPLRCPNCTVPSARANRVSSPPRPTLIPGWNLVPRWRTMMVAACTEGPPKLVTPRRWAFESRPFRVEPPPLVLDMSSDSFCRRSAGRRDRGDLDGRVPLAMTPALRLVRLVLVGEAADLRPELLAHHLGGDRGAGQGLWRGQDSVAVDHQDGPKGHPGAR